jgi:hypothetical protein
MAPPPQRETWPPIFSTVEAARAGDLNAIAQMESDATQVVEWIINGRGLSIVFPTKEFSTMATEKGWHPSYAAAVLPLAKDLLSAYTTESPHQSRARLILALEQARREASMQGNIGHEIAAIKAQADILLPKASINVNTTPTEIKDLRNMSNEELESILSQTGGAPRA